MEALDIDNPDDMAVELRGDRIALVNCNIRSPRYSVFAHYTQDTHVCTNYDIIFYQNRMYSYYDSGVSNSNEATIRIFGTIRSKTQGNYLLNDGDPPSIQPKHNYRVHGVSEENYAIGNVFGGGGVMTGDQPGDSIDEVSVNENLLFWWQC